MEAARFIKLLRKHRYTLAAIPMLIMAITFMLVRNQPDTFLSRSILSAGILESSQNMVLGKDLLGDTKTNQQFSNLIQTMQMKQVYDLVSYRLMLHDLTHDPPYRKKSKLLAELPPEALQHAYEVYKEHYESRKPLSLWNEDEKGLFKVIKSMGYDYATLSKKLHIYRIDNSDFINVEYETDSPKLAAFVVNTLCEEFIKYYTYITKDNEHRTIRFLDTLLEEKRGMFDSSTERLKDFKIRNGVLNLEEEAKSLTSQIADLETRVQNEEKEIRANEGALKSINERLTSSDKEYSDTLLSSLNRSILMEKKQLDMLNEEYVKSGFDPRIKLRIDALDQSVQLKINQTADRASVNQSAIRGSLISQKISLEVKRDLARNSIKTLTYELEKLKARYLKLVPNEAVIQSYQENITTTRQEYLNLKEKYFQTNLTYNASVQLKQIEPAMPEPPLPSKKMLLVAVSGVGSFVFCLLVLFVLFYLDNSINSAAELANRTTTPVLGFLPLLPRLDFKTGGFSELWDSNTPIVKELKNQLRSLRFETEEAMGGGKVLAITSLDAGRGKSFVSLCLANAYMMVNKKVLLIDGDFGSPHITEAAYANTFIEDYFNNRAYAPTPAYRNDITVAGNRGNDLSLFEVSSEDLIRRKLSELKDIYDVIIIDCPSLNTLNQCKEWISVADKVLAVFEANRSITGNLSTHLSYLKSKNGKFIGWVLNKFPLGKKGK